VERQRLTLLCLALIAVALVGCGPAESPNPPPPPPLFPEPAAESGSATPVPIVDPAVDPAPVPEAVVANSATLTAAPTPEPVVASSETLVSKPKTPQIPPAPPPNWVWLPVPTGHPVFLRRRFPVKGNITRAVLKVACDGHADVFINGKPVVHVQDGSITMEIDSFLQAGVNAIGVHAKKPGGPGAFALWLNYLGPETARALHTDNTWQGRHMPEDGWTEGKLIGRDWYQVSDLGPVGADDRPMPDAYKDLRLVRSVPRKPPRQATPPEELRLPPDFQAEMLYAVPRDQGSWITVCQEPKGGLLFGAHGGSIYRLSERPGKPPVVQELKTEVKGTQGLVYHAGALFAAINREKQSGVYRLQDNDGDGEYEEEILLKALDATGEHGIHGIVASPDGKRLYLTVGNHSKLPEGLARSRIAGPFQDDSLIAPIRPAQPGFAAPGGYVCSFDLNGEDWQLHSVGFRNCYDLTFNSRGDLFAFDADAENDAGAPWYRPNRLLQVVSGGDYGWRPGTNKWHDFFPDTLPTLYETSRGSPTSLFTGAKAAFPPRYRQAIFLLDWARGAVDAAWLSPKGASYSAKSESFLQGTGFPVVDGIITADGSMLLVTGGRFLPSAVYRIRYVGPQQPGDPKPKPTPKADLAHKLRQTLEAFHGVEKAEAVPAALAQLGHADRHIRYAARLALEAQPIAQWRDKALEAESPLAVLTGALAIARRGGTEDQAALHSALQRFDFAALDTAQRLLLLRSYTLASLRQPFSDEQNITLRERLLPHFPDPNDQVDHELASLLAHLQTPQLLARMLLLLASEPAASTAEANAMSGFEVAIEERGKTLSRRQLHYASLLRRAVLPWTDAQRRAYFKWLDSAVMRAISNVYGYIVRDIRSDALAALGDAAEPYKTEDEYPEAPSQPPAAQGPGRAWTVDEALEVIGDGLTMHKFEDAKTMFTVAQCSRCHRVGTEGSTIGPDLTTLAGRFGKREILEAIIHPSNAISDQYGYQRVTLNSGAVHYGRAASRDDTSLRLSSNPFDPNDLIEIPVAEIAEEVPAEISPMPPALINMLNPDELRDLMAYLLAGGNPEHPLFLLAMIRSAGPPPPPPEDALTPQAPAEDAPPAENAAPEEEGEK
jgi:putative heme-binding domain-containing protein